MRRVKKTSWVKSKRTLSFVYQFGIIGLVNAYLYKERANSKFMSELSFARTMHIHKRKKECSVPVLLEGIAEGLHEKHFGPNIPPEEYCLRLFDQVHFYAWIPRGTKMLLNMKLLFDILAAVKTKWRSEQRNGALIESVTKPDASGD